MSEPIAEKDAAEIIADHTVCPRIGGEMCNGAGCNWRSWEDGGSHEEHVAALVLASLAQPAAPRPMDKAHDVKCWPEYFDAICSGRKQFEVRLNDRDYREGDALLLREYDPETDAFSGRLILAQIGYVLPLDSRGARGHVAFSLTGCVLPPGEGRA